MFWKQNRFVALVKSLQKNGGTVARIIAHASLIRSASGQRAMDDTCATDNLIQKSSDEWSISLVDHVYGHIYIVGWCRWLCYLQVA